MSERPATDCNPDKCASCPQRGSCGYPLDEIAAIAETIRNVGTIYVVVSGKGGCGKSTVATQLAFYLSERMQERVGLLDVDLCGPSIPTMTGSQDAQVISVSTADGSDTRWEPVHVTQNLTQLSIGCMLPTVDSPVVLRGPKKHEMIFQCMSNAHWPFTEDALRGDPRHNYLVVDTPPGTSDEHLSTIGMMQEAAKYLRERAEAAVRAGAAPESLSVPDIFAVVVSTPQEVALADVRKEINFCRQVNLPILGVVENMSGFVCPHCQTETQIFVPSTGGVEALCASQSVSYLGRIPIDPSLMQAEEEGVPWFMKCWDDESAGFSMFEDVVLEILKGSGKA